MTIFVVEKYGGEFEDSWHTIDKCFNDEKLAEQYIEQQKEFDKYMESLRKEFIEIQNVLNDNIPSCGLRKDFKYWEDSYENFIFNLKKCIPNIFTQYDEKTLKNMFDYFIEGYMIWSSRGEMIHYTIIPLHVETSL